MVGAISTLHTPRSLGRGCPSWLVRNKEGPGGEVKLHSAFRRHALKTCRGKNNYAKSDWLATQTRNKSAVLLRETWIRTPSLRPIVSRPPSPRCGLQAPLFGFASFLQPVAFRSRSCCKVRMAASLSIACFPLRLGSWFVLDRAPPKNIALRPLESFPPPF